MITISHQTTGRPFSWATWVTWMAVVWAAGGCATSPAAIPELQPAGAATADATITLSTIAVEGSRNYQIIERVYDEALAALGYEFELLHNSGIRSIEEVRLGRVDGEAIRVANFRGESGIDDLIRVDEPVLEAVFAAYALDSSLVVDGFESFIGRDWIVAYPRGAELIGNNLQLVLDESQVVTVDDARQAIAMTAAGRVTMMVATTDTEPLMGEDPLTRVGVVAEVPLHTFFNLSQTDLARQLSAQLKSMKASGRYEEIISEIDQRLKTP